MNNEIKKEEQMYGNKNHVITQAEQSDVVISNMVHDETLTPTLSLYKGRGSEVKELLKSVLDYWQVGRLNAALPRTSFAIAPLLPKSAVQNDNYKNLYAFNLKKKLAITLAEVLITLGIIGVVAALTIPSLINNYKAKRLHSQFLKSYSTVQQVFKQMEADDVSLDPNTYGGIMFYKTFMNYLTGATDCFRNLKNPACAPELNSDYYSTKKDLYKTLDGSKTVIHWYFDDGMISLQDGTLLMFENPGGEDGNIWVSVDLNGYNNPPNRWGYDLFTFQFVDGELKTMGDKGTIYTDAEIYCNPKGSDKLNGVACAHKAKVNSDYFKDLVKDF